jgi:hypothetical protein
MLAIRLIQRKIKLPTSFCDYRKRLFCSNNNKKDMFKLVEALSSENLILSILGMGGMMVVSVFAKVIVYINTIRTRYVRHRQQYLVFVESLLVYY